MWILFLLHARMRKTDELSMHRAGLLNMNIFTCRFLKLNMFNV